MNAVPDIDEKMYGPDDPVMPLAVTPGEIYWKDRAMEAERKVAALRNTLQGVEDSATPIGEMARDFNTFLIEMLIDRQARGDYYHAMLLGNRAEYDAWGGQGDWEDENHAEVSDRLRKSWMVEGKQNVEKIIGHPLPPVERTYTPIKRSGQEDD